MIDYSGSPSSLISSLLRNRSLIVSMTRREVGARYRGSMLGLAWSFINPLLLLFVYTFVFSVVFNARWGGSRFDSVETVSVAVMIFIGMVVHGVFAESFVRSPGLITDNSNFVKRVVFPLEILAPVSLGAGLFHSAISLLVLFCAQWFLGGFLPWTALLLPLVLFPLALMTLGVTWFFGAAGVYFRDLAQLSGFISTILLFLSPVFYPLSAIPEDYQWLFYLNPLTFVIESCRDLLVYGQLPSFLGVLVYSLCSAVIAWLGYVWFQKTRRGFADVL